MGFNEDFNSQKADFYQHSEMNSEVQLFRKNIVNEIDDIDRIKLGTSILSPTKSDSNESLPMNSSEEKSISLSKQDNSLDEESIVITRQNDSSELQLGILTPPPSRQSGSYDLRIRRKRILFSPSPIRTSKVRKYKMKQKKTPVHKFEIPPKTFKQIVLDIIKEQSVSGPRIEDDAVTALQEASEAFLTEHFVTWGRMMALSNKKTLSPNIVMLYNCAKVIF